jgi:hypothetical protein
MFAYDPGVSDRSGEILAMSMMGAADTQAKSYNQLGENIGDALASLGYSFGGAMSENKRQKNTFEGNYRFLTQRNMLPSNVQNAALDLIGQKNYAAANAYIAPYLEELDFGRRAYMAGRTGFFDANGAWQPAMQATPVSQRNREGYVYRAGS